MKAEDKGKEGERGGQAGQTAESSEQVQGRPEIKSLG